MTPHLGLTRFAGSHEEGTIRRALPNGGAASLTAFFAGAEWEIAATLEPAPERPEAIDGPIALRVTGGAGSCHRRRRLVWYPATGSAGPKTRRPVRPTARGAVGGPA